jgi:hypothetical protein
MGHAGAFAVQNRSDRTYRGRWTITFSNPPINVFVSTTIVELGALVTDPEEKPSVKVVAFQWLGEPHAGHAKRANQGERHRKE